MLGAGERRHVLILGGTTEAYELATALAGRDDLLVTSSLAGVTAAPRLPAGAHRIGGFGGVAGMRAWLAAEQVALVVDASHPFAVRISAQAREATGAVGCGCLRLARPGWQAEDGDRWHLVPDLEAGLDQLRRLGAQRVFAALGARAVPQLAAAPMRFVVRGIEPPATLPGNVTWLQERGPFAVADERHLLADQRIDAVLSRDSGGDGARAKLDAARELRLPVVMIERPPTPAGETVEDVQRAIRWLDQRLPTGPRAAVAKPRFFSSASGEGSRPRKAR